MDVTNDRRRHLAAIMFASLMLQACGNGSDTQSALKNNPTSTETPLPPATDTIIDGQNPGSEPEFRLSVGDTVLFATDHHDLSAEAQSQLQRQAAWLMQYPAWQATVQGYADERGTREYNLALGERRAETIRAYLIALGVDTARLQTTSYGKEQPLCGEASDDCWQRNRRGTTVLNP